ncbi:hypothetical protein [Butyrivibrio sp. WCE2006]|uniref:hypothetical protein n=1 Tax=Butyrivibrio sp. WCE2006 TaxID=1410611 RepID=UPI0005D20A2B|nr:hypothetical protein [Butyrivibrio sp. WCE2006]
MGVNGVTCLDQASTYYEPTTTAKAAEATSEDKTAKTAEAKNDKAAVFEKSDNTSAVGSTNKTYKKNEAVISMLKNDLEERQNQLKDIVSQMMSKQGVAIGKADDIWSFLAKGDFTIDEAAKKKAQEEISEDGYWGVKQTSQRILDFANALTGGDPGQIDKMRSAFEKGFKEATKSWGKELPDISKQTYDAVMKGFDDMAAKNNTEAPVEDNPEIV